MKNYENNGTNGDFINAHGLTISKLILNQMLHPICHASIINRQHYNKLNCDFIMQPNIRFNNVINKFKDSCTDGKELFEKEQDELPDINTWLGKGVNKSNLIPLMFVSADLYIKNYSLDLDGTGSMFAKNSDDFVKLNKINLVEFYKYSEADAASFIRNFGTAGKKGGYKVGEIKILKPNIMTSLDWKVISHHICSDDQTVHMWTNCELRDCNQAYSEMFEKDTSIQAEKMMSYIDIINDDLDYWKLITEDWLSQYKPDFPRFENLDSSTRKRLIVNSIRHNAVNYVMSWITLESEVHDAIFCLVNKKIAKMFPTLKTEAMKQIEDRDYNF